MEQNGDGGGEEGLYHRSAEQRIDLLEEQITEQRTICRKIASDTRFLTTLAKAAQSKGMIFESDKKMLAKLLEERGGMKEGEQNDYVGERRRLEMVMREHQTAKGKGKGEGWEEEFAKLST